MYSYRVFVGFVAALFLVSLPFAAGAEDKAAAEMFRSIAVGNSGQLKSLLASGGNANAANAEGESLLHLAVRLNQAPAAELLLTAGASGLNGLHEFTGATKTIRMRLLSFAVWNGNQEMVQTLLKHGADVNALDGDGRSAMAGAIATGSDKAVKALLSAGADPNLRWRPGYSAMSYAAFRGGADILTTLLDHGGDADLRDDHGLTPLMLAVQKKREDAVSVLLAHGARLYPLDAWHQSALSYAKRVNDADIGNRLVSALIKAGAKEGETVRAIDQAFLEACHDGDIEEAEELLAQGADLHARGVFDGQLLLADALSASVAYPKLVRFLLDKGINPFMLSSYDFTALHLAAADGTPAVIEMLVGRGLDPNARSKSGFVPLFMAMNGRPRPENVDVLLKLGADPNGPSIRRGENLLQFARAKKLAGIADMLMASGAR